MQGRHDTGHRAAIVAALLIAVVPGAAPANGAEDPVVIELGTTAVTRAELDARFALAVRLLARRQGVALAEQDPGLVEALRQQYLDKRATELVLLEEARRRQLVVSDAQVDAAFGELFQDETDIEALIADAGLDPEAGRALLDDVLRAEQTVELLTEHMLREIRVPTGDVITLHHDAKHLLATPEEVCLRHIQVADEDSARALLARIEAGAEFAELAAAHSSDAASASAGGDLGCFERGPAGPRTAFERAAFAADEGEAVGPVESRYGFHVLVVYEHRMPREPTLNEAYAEIERELALEELPERMQALLESSGVRVHADRYAE